MTDHPTTPEKDERAEAAYLDQAFDVPSAPLGSRDWSLFKRGWDAATRALPDLSAGACQKCGGSGFIVWEPQGYAERDRCDACKGTGSVAALALRQHGGMVTEGELFLVNEALLMVRSDPAWAKLAGDTKMALERAALNAALAVGRG